MRIGVAILSYNGRLGFGITGDFDTATDIDVVADGIEAEIALAGAGDGTDRGGSQSTCRRTARR